MSSGRTWGIWYKQPPTDERRILVRTTSSVTTRTTRGERSVIIRLIGGKVWKKENFVVRNAERQEEGVSLVTLVTQFRGAFRW